MALSGNSTVDMTAPCVSDDLRKVPDDKELLRRAGQGDQTAFRELLDRHARYLYGIAHSLTRNPADAEDLVQETWIGAIRSTFRGDASVRTWLVSILVRQAAALRRSKRRSKWRLVLPWFSGRDVESDALPGDEPAASSSIPGSEARMDLSRMLETLSPEHREVIVLRELQGLSYEEIATELSLPRGTVESRLHRAREQLRTRFEGYL
jgi:RNA polymerase sigma-70 factor, ECF subfamily